MTSVCWELREWQKCPHVFPSSHVKKPICRNRNPHPVFPSSSSSSFSFSNSVCPVVYAGISDNGRIVWRGSFQREGRLLELTTVTAWDDVLSEICEHWELDASRVIVKFVIPDAHGTISPIESQEDFWRMCHIHAILKKNMINMTVEEVGGAANANINVFPAV